MLAPLPKTLCHEKKAINSGIQSPFSIMFILNLYFILLFLFFFFPGPNFVKGSLLEGEKTRSIAA